MFFNDLKIFSNFQEIEAGFLKRKTKTFLTLEQPASFDHRSVSTRLVF
jgi:hypothetical protein